MAQRTPRGQGRNAQRRMRYKDRKFENMLDLGRFDYFKYDTREVLANSGIDEANQNIIFSSLTAKASRQSIGAAKDFLREKVEDGTLPEETAEQLSRLLSKYKKRR